MSQLPLVLASSSPYRKALLERLQIPFTCVSPDIDESLRNNENAPELASRLAIEKAHAVGEKLDEPALVIGSDQVVVLGDKILGKPGDHQTAVEQLSLCSGNTVRFVTGLCLLNTKTQRYLSDVDEFFVHFRQLSRQDIGNYLSIEKPYDCAGSFKSEGLGIALIERMAGNDPNSLVGLPLISLVSMLHKEGVIFFQHRESLCG